jgi:hypothetical protein
MLARTELALYALLYDEMGNFCSAIVRRKQDHVSWTGLDKQKLTEL